MTAIIISAVLLAVSLCADCFAVSSCSSVTLKTITWRRVIPVAFAFGVIQTGLMAAGWFFGDMFVDFVEKVAHWIGFLLLLYVGGSMILEALRGEGDSRDLDGLKNVILGGVATSIDAFAVGISLSMGRVPSIQVCADLVAVFLVTMLSVIAGMFGGQMIGRRFGKAAEIVGGAVLVLIGLGILLDLI